MTTSLRLFLLSVTLAAFAFAEDALVSEELETIFFTACSSGDDRTVARKIKDSSNGIDVNTRTMDGETCLHLASIPGSVAVTSVLLKAGADPNIRTTFSEGLRMHPLSWNVYAGHDRVVELLLENGADVNADFDLSMESDEKVTVLDIVERIIENRDPDLDSDLEGLDEDELDGFDRIRTLLLAKGAKRYADLNTCTEL